jgi:simple sugar transport system substrate-binding protein
VKIFESGAKAAAVQFGPKVDYVFSGWNPEKMAAQLRDAIAAKPDGIAMMGHPGTAALMPLAKSAQKAGILLSFVNVDVPDVRAKYGGGYVGANQGGQGTAVGQRAVQLLHLKKGDGAIVVGAFSQPVERRIREENLAKAFEAAGLKVQRIDGPPAVATDPNVLTPLLSAALLRAPNTRVIGYPGGQNLGYAPQYMKALGKRPGQIFNVGFDITPEVIKGFQQGYVQLTGDQEIWQQGYLPILSLCLQKQYGFAPLVVDTGAGFVETTNYKKVAPLVAKGIRG